MYGTKNSTLTLAHLGIKSTPTPTGYTEIVYKSEIEFSFWLKKFLGLPPVGVGVTPKIRITLLLFSEYRTATSDRANDLSAQPHRKARARRRHLSHRLFRTRPEMMVEAIR